jgi:sterol desaturase/sphingolipid hydroxylase (fatty acid hydroxylase superfamily)
VERNLGTVFTCWDRLRGTFVIADPPPEVRFGLPVERETYPQDWPRQLVAPWRAS